MQVVYKFNVPEDSDYLEIYQKAENMHSALFDIVNYLRNQYKYYSENPPNIEEIYKSVIEILNDQDVPEDLK